MSDSVFTSLINSVDRGSVRQIAGSLGETEQSVWKGMESSIAAVLSSLAGKSEVPGALQQVLDSASHASGDVSWTQIAGTISDPHSPFISGGKRLLSGLFGSGEGATINALSRQSSLRTGTTSTLMAIAAPLVLGYFSKRLRNGEMTISGLGNILRGELPSLRSALPAGLIELPVPTGRVSGVSLHTADEGQSGPRWLMALGIGVLLAGLLWFFTHKRVPTTAEISPTASGSASRLATDIADFVSRKLPNDVDLNIPKNGVEERLVVFIQDPALPVDQNASFDFDRLLFDSASATLQPKSQEQLRNIAAILTAYPNVHLKVCGYADNAGSTEQNLALSRDRANSVVADLVSKGIAPDRLAAEGFGEQYSVASNSTEEGRAKNRRVSMVVTRK
jgi:OmpA-OmpF porin, OOP family